MHPNFERMIATISSRPSLIAGKMVNGDGVPCTTGALLLSVRPNLQHELRVAAISFAEVGDLGVRSSIREAQELCGIGPQTWLVLQHFNDWCSGVEGVNRISIRNAVLKMLIAVKANWHGTVVCSIEPQTRGGCDVLCAKLVMKYWTQAIVETRARVTILADDLNKTLAAAVSAELALASLPDESPPKFSLSWLGFESEKLFFAPFKKMVKLADLYVEPKALKAAHPYLDLKTLDTILPPLTVEMAEALYPPSFDEEHTEAVPTDKVKQQLAIDDLIESTQVDFAKATEEMIAVAIFSKV